MRGPKRKAWMGCRPRILFLLKLAFSPLSNGATSSDSGPHTYHGDLLDNLKGNLSYVRRLSIVIGSFDESTCGSEKKLALKLMRKGGKDGPAWVSLAVEEKGVERREVVVLFLLVWSKGWGALVAWRIILLGFRKSMRMFCN
ncbi:hypothetical protein AVEN_53629-1 [Araneus ventricosus]|uniref:Uncharacterized protein n=1 Tax=Araneus ventricosus TaxID=182803 RepID=A0A4Y2RJY0_ARAVE|nr:hypothetical protein AVEN_53629-1 [Araneus ventricosus]